MVLTQVEDLYILHNDHFVVVLIENSPGPLTRSFVAFGEKQHSVGISLWSITETLSIWIFTNTFEDFPYRFFQLLISIFMFLWCRLQPLPRALSPSAMRWAVRAVFDDFHDVDLGDER